MEEPHGEGSKVGEGADLDGQLRHFVLVKLVQ